MSLKFFHIFFIIAAIGLSIYVGLWCRQQGQPMICTVASYVCAGALAVYLLWFLKKSKGLR